LTDQRSERKSRVIFATERPLVALFPRIELDPNGTQGDDSHIGTRVHGNPWEYVHHGICFTMVYTRHITLEGSRQQ